MFLQTYCCDGSTTWEPVASSALTETRQYRLNGMKKSKIKYYSCGI